MAEQFANDVETTLAAPMTNSEVVASVVSVAGFPATPSFRIRVENEIMLVVLLVGGSPPGFYVGRGWEGTAAVSHPADAAVVHVLTAGALGGQSDATGTTPSLRSLGSSATTAAAGNDPRIPTQNENDALAGTSGTPSAANPFVTDGDSRLGAIPNAALTFNPLTNDYTLASADVLPGNIGRAQRGDIASGQSKKLIVPLAADVMIPDGVRFPLWPAGLGTWRVGPDHYWDEVMADAPSLYWRLGEASGTTANDETANNRDGTYVGTPTLGSAGGLVGDAPVDTDTAVDLNGSTQYISSTYNPFTASGIRTFEGLAWRRTSTSADALFGSAGSSQATLRLSSGSQNVEFFTDTGLGAQTWTAAWPGNAQWVHWALVFNDATNAANLYINGASATGNPKTQANPYVSPGNFRVGARSTIDCFDGKLDEIAVYESGLSAARIKAHYASSVTKINSVNGNRVLLGQHGGAELVHYTGNEWWMVGALA